MEKRLEHGELISPSPIRLSIGYLRKPTLAEISDTKNGMSFEKFYYFEALAKMTPEYYFIKIKGDEGKKHWESLSEEEQKKIKLFNIIINDSDILKDFIEMLNFFFEETVIVYGGFFILLKPDANVDELSAEMIAGAISQDTLDSVLDLIQQICCIKADQEEEEEPLFKNEYAEKMYRKMQKSELKLEAKANLDLTIPNIISSVANKHPSLNLINIWGLTVFQLIESFNRLQVNESYDIGATRVSVWGDEKKTFDTALWYKNLHEKQEK